MEIKYIQTINKIKYSIIIINNYKNKCYLLWGIGDWGLGIGDWGLGIWGLAQSPIPNPQSPIPTKHFQYNNNNIINYNKLINEFITPLYVVIFIRI